MKSIFVNLKRFDIPRAMGGLCPMESPVEWIKWILDQSIDLGLGILDGAQVNYLLPESLILPAYETLNQYPEKNLESISIGCQGIFYEDVEPGGNFGAFTTSLPAAAAKNMGCEWTMIGHSEERKDKLNIINTFEPECDIKPALRLRASDTVNQLINQEVLCAFKRDINVILCIGETADERGEGSLDAQKSNIKEVLKRQLDIGLGGVAEVLGKNSLVIGYEPIWAIGPGKTPPDADYIGFVSSYIKEVVIDSFGFDPHVVYGGGLKEDNAKMIASIPSIDGGLVALTKFIDPIGFDPKELKKIVDKYLK